MMMQPIVMQGHDWLHEDLGKDYLKSHVAACHSAA